MLPGFAEIPAVVPRRILRTVFAMLVDYRGAADNGFETVRLSLDERCHFATVTVTHQRHAIAINRLGFHHIVNPGHNVAIVPASKIVLVRSRKSGAVAGTSPRIGSQYRPT